MKLLRLRSDDTTLNFEGNLNTNLILPPNSKIGLKNISFNKIQNYIQFNNVNNQFSFTIGNGNVYQVDLPTNVENSINYALNNVSQLAELMEDYMNKELDLSNALVIGGKWTNTIDYTTNKLELNFKQEPKVNIVQSKIGGYSQVGMTDADHTNITKTDLTSNLPSACIGVQQSGSKNYEAYSSQFRTLTDNQGVETKVCGTGGCGFVRCQIKTISADVANSGFFIGLSPLKINQFSSGGSNNFAVGRFQYALYAKNSGSNYEFMNHTNAGSPSVGSFAPAVNDVMELALSDGVMKINVYSTSNPNGREIFSGLNTLSNDILYPYLVFYNGNGNSVSSYEFTPINPPPVETELEASHLLSYDGGVTPPIQELYNRLYELTWAGFEPWYLYLGFIDIYEFNESVSVTFFSDQSFNFVDNTECYLVLVDNYALTSYDLANKDDIKTAGGQKSILAVIQNARNKNDDNVLFEESNPIMIDIENANPIMFKNLNIRIVTDQYSQISTAGKSGNMCILLE